MTLSSYLRVFLMALCFVLASSLSSPAFAQDEDTKEELQQSVNERVSEFTADFDAASEKHFFAVYGSYNIIQVVEDVRTQVGDAIEKCGDVNPDMKDALDARYKDWDGALEPIMDDANANVENMIIAQDYAKPRAFRKLLKFTNKQREKREDQAEKFPVTSPEACEYLRNKMDETQTSLTRLLESTLVSLPNAMINEGKDDSDEKSDE